jgi:hypothetical protein
VTSNGNASASLPPPYGGTVRSGSMGGVRAGWQQQGQQGQVCVHLCRDSVRIKQSAHARDGCWAVVGWSWDGR